MFALVSGTGRRLAHRADERFLMFSTFKGVLAAEVLADIDAGTEDPQARVPYRRPTRRRRSPARLAKFRGVTDQAVSAIGGITHRIRETDTVATSIAAAVEEQAAATQEIVRNVSQAAIGTSEVTGAIAGVAQVSEETGTAASQVLSAASEFSRHSEQLNAEVTRFLATVRAA